MGYLGRDIQYGSFAKQTLTANSSTTVFTLSNGVADANNLLVSIGGIIQEPNVAYTAIGTVLTFASAPVTDDPIFITYLGMETTTAASSRDDVTYQIGTGNGTTTPLTLSTSVVNSDAVRVSLNGVVQKPWTDFTASGTTLTFTTAPDATNEILVYYIGKEDSISDVTTGSVTAAKFTSSGTMPAWNGSAITGIDVLPYSKFNDLKTNLSLMGFRRSQHHGTSNLNLPNGFIDQFEDQTNVDDTNSVNELYDTTGDFYTGINFPVWETGDRTSSITVTTNVTLATGTIGLLVDGVKGATNLYFSAQTAAGKFIKFDFLSGKIIVDAGFIQNDPRNHGTWKWQGSTNDSTWVDLGSSFTLGTAQNLVRQTFTTQLGSNTTAYRYYRMLGVSGSCSNAPWVYEMEFKAHGDGSNITLISETETAATAPEKAYVTLFNEPVDSVTLNTDIMAWVSRSSKTITATNATNVLNATAHGLSNTDRVILTTSASDLPNGLSETAYHVVNKTANTFQVSLTSGGAAVTFSDDGTGTHTSYAVTQTTLADKGDYGTGKTILAGTADISGQPTGTDVRLIVQTKNNKETKLHGMAVQYGKKDA